MDLYLASPHRMRRGQQQFCATFSRSYKYTKAETSVGERLFLETRFAQTFKGFLDNSGNINNPSAGDPVMNLSETIGQGTGFPGPFAGLKIFMSKPPPLPLPTGGIGNCITCHAAPNFTDFKLHNTGVTQREFDDHTIGAGHAAGSFAAHSIPNLATRTDNDFPATEQHLGASEWFRSIPTAGTTLTNLGAWNIFANPDMLNPHARIRAILCDDQIPCLLYDAALLDRAIARFKTPGLRDLSYSAPYMHNGQFAT